MEICDSKEIRVEMRLRNNRLWNLIFPRWDSVTAFCNDLNLHQGEVGGLLNLKRHPVSLKRGTYRPTCQKIAEYFRMLPEDLFPLTIYELAQTEGSTEIGPEQIPFHECVLLPAPDMIDPFMEALSNKQLLEKLLPLATFRERRFLEKKFGCGEYDPHTYDEIGLEEGIAGERVRQIIEKGLRRIRKKPGLEKMRR